MIVLFYAGVGEESAELLCKEIKNLGAEVKLIWQKDGLSTNTLDKAKLLVSWGAYGAREYLGNWLNHKIHANKLNQLIKLSEASVPVPKFMPGMPGQAGWYARKIKHRDGNDLAKKLMEGDFYVKHVDTTKEYRVHVFKGKILRASLKVPLNDKAKLPFRTGDNWGFSSKNYASLLGPCGDAALAAVAAIKYDFGGVDVALTPGGKAVVFEVNAAPWLGGDAARRYAKAIVSTVGGVE
jgi:hypothetical protein